LKDIHILDRNKKDKYLLRAFGQGDHKFTGAVSLLDSEKNKVLGILNVNGDFYLDPKSNLKLELKGVQDKNDPVIFVLKSRENLIAEFYIYKDQNPVLEGAMQR
jgi:hypothetical protein